MSDTVPNMSVPAGWYPDPTSVGTVRYWDGEAWTDSRSPADLTVSASKDVGVAYIFAILLGGFGAHRLYLRRIGSGVAQGALNVVGLVTMPFLIGFFIWPVFLVWWVIDLFLLPGMVREENAQRR